MSGFKHFLVKVSSLRLLPIVLVKSFRIISSGAGDKKKVIVSLVQHLGDNVAAEPLDAYLRLQNKESFMVRIIDKKFIDVIRYSPHHDSIVTVSCLSEWIYLKIILKLFFKVYDLHVHRSFCSVYRLSVSNPNSLNVSVGNYYDIGNLLKTFCINAGVPVIDKKPVYWLAPGTTLPKLPSSYVVIHVSSNSAAREWENGKWIELIKYINREYQVEVIEIGISSALNYEEDGYHNFCGKLSFSEIALLISGSMLFIGIDSAFAHFANSFPVRKLILLGHFGVFRNYLPYSGLTEEEILSDIIRYDGDLKNLEVDTVKAHLEKKLPGKLIRG